MSKFNIKKGTRVEISSKADGKMEYKHRKIDADLVFSPEDVVISPEDAYEKHGITNCNYYTFKYKYCGQLFWITVKQALLTTS